MPETCTNDPAPIVSDLLRETRKRLWWALQGNQVENAKGYAAVIRDLAASASPYESVDQARAEAIFEATAARYASRRGL